MLLVVAAVYAIAHLAAMFTDFVHWDELVLFRRTEVAAATGVLDGGGRPGLAAALLVLVVDGCESTFRMVLATRMVWAASTFLLLAGLFVFVLQATRRSAHAWHAAALGTASLAFVPHFLRWSLQIRTDQPAAACALWAGVALFASIRRPRFALLAGVLFAIGYLFTQKAFYVTALVGLVVLGDLYIERAFAWKREAQRVAWMILGAVVIVGIYRFVMPRLFTSPVSSLESSFNLLDWYRWVLRFRLYPNMVSSVIPQLALLVLILVAAIRAMRRDTEQRRPLLVALAVCLLGIGVGRFHTGSFPHFWITIGIFPAVAIGLGWNGIRELLPRANLAVAILAWGWLIVTAAIYRRETLIDTQAVQRASFAFVESQLDPGLRGFSSDGAFVCRHDPDPLPVYLGHEVTLFLFGKNGARNTDALLEQFRTRPVAYVLDTHRLPSFPQRWRDFFAAHYVLYTHRVALAGQAITGGRGSSRTFDVIVPGRYRWFPGVTQARITVDGIPVDHEVTLAAGAHAIVLADPVTAGMLVLAVDAPPEPASETFYPGMAIYELAGARTRFW
jgi:hypothetical protein